VAAVADHHPTAPRPVADRGQCAANAWVLRFAPPRRTANSSAPFDLLRLSAGRFKQRSVERGPIREPRKSLLATLPVPWADAGILLRSPQWSRSRSDRHAEESISFAVLVCGARPRSTAAASVCRTSNIVRHASAAGNSAVRRPVLAYLFCPELHNASIMLLINSSAAPKVGHFKI
jgi:hypothetical protein